MKRFLSIMLTVMLVLSSFVMVSAEEDAFSVIKVTEAETFAFEAVNGYYKISADVYVTADVTSATIEATLAGEKVAEGTIDLEKDNAWQAVTIDLVNASADGLKFAAAGGAIYVNNIKVDKAYAKNILYKEDFEYDKPLTITNHTAPGEWDAFAAAVSANPISSFENVVFDGRTVGVLEQPRQRNANVYRFDDEGNAKTAELLTAENGYEYFVLDVPALAAEDHAFVEFDLYNAANSLSTENYDPVKANVKDSLKFSIMSSTQTSNVTSSNVPSAVLAMDGITLYGRTAGGNTGSGENIVEPKTWAKVLFEIERTGADSAEYAIYYGGKKVDFRVENNLKSGLNRIVFNVPSANGGKFYIDNFEVYTIEEVKDSFVERYSEDFENKNDGTPTVVGDKVEYGHYGSTKDSTFTVDATYDEINNPLGKSITGNNSKYGRLYQPGAAASSTRYLDNGTTPDEGVVAGDQWTNENFYKVTGIQGLGVSKADDVKKTRLTFKYYLPGSAMKDGKSVEQLIIGFSRNNLQYIATSASPQIKISGNNVNLGNASSQDTNNGTHNMGIKRWIPVTVDIKSTCKSYSDTDPRYNHEITYNVGAYSITQTITKTNYYDLGMMGMLVDETYGGIAYIDDIKIETNFLANDFEAVKEDLVYENVLTKSAAIKSTSDEFKVTSGTFGGSPQSINIVKMPGNTESVKVVTAVYNGNVLYDAAINPVSAADLVEFAETTVELTNAVEVPSDISEYKFKVFVFDTEEGLRPLADMFSDSVVIETPAE